MASIKKTLALIGNNLNLSLDILVGLEKGWNVRQLLLRHEYGGSSRSPCGYTYTLYAEFI